MKQTLIIGWYLMGTNVLSQLALMTIQKKRRIEKNRQFLFITSNAYVIMVDCIQWYQERANISQAMYTILWKKHLLKIGDVRVCWDLTSAKIFLILLIMIYQRGIWDVTFVSDNCGMKCPKQLSYWKNHIFLWGP